MDVGIKVRIEKVHTVARKLYGRRKSLQDQREFRRRGRRCTAGCEWAGDKALALEAKLKHGMLLLWATVAFAVPGESLEVAKARALQLMQRYQPAHFRVLVPPGDQRRIWHDFLPGTRQTLNDWAVPMDPHYLAISMLHGSRDLGDPRGMHLGRQGSGAPVFFGPGRPMRELNRSGALGITGTLGGGKSYLKEKIIHGGLLQGAEVISLDPKDEDHVLAQVPESGPVTRLARLAPGTGVQLNPFAVSPDPERSRAAVVDVLSMVLDLNRPDNEVGKLAVYDAVSAVIGLNPEERSLVAVMKALDALRRVSYEEGSSVMVFVRTRKVPPVLGYARGVTRGEVPDG